VLLEVWLDPSPPTVILALDARTQLSAYTNKQRLRRGEMGPRVKREDDGVC